MAARMAQEKYAYAVATVRIKESALLSTDFLEQLLSTNGYDAVRRQLAERGWISAEADDDDDRLQKQLIDSWALLREIAPEPDRFDALVLKNDYHNLKAALKCSFIHLSPEQFFMKPCLYDADELAKAVDDRQFDALPEEWMRDAAKQAHDVTMRTQDGQYADVIIDTAALAAIRDAGRRSGSALIDDVTELVCAAANVKTALRSVRTKKDAHFLDTALCVCDTLDKPALIAAALKGEEALRVFLRTTPYADAAQTLGAAESGESSLSALEKWFDDRLMERIQSTKYSFFGPEPLAAYYIAREAELRNIRILLSGKRHGVEDAVIRERMRRLYV